MLKAINILYIWWLFLEVYTYSILYFTERLWQTERYSKFIYVCYIWNIYNKKVSTAC